MFAIISAGIAPGIALLSYFYLKDQYDNEPVHMVLRSFFLGVVLVFPIMFIQYVLEKENVGGGSFFVSFLSSGFLEESLKWFILMISVYPHAHFDEHYDGIVYGASVSLGFATLENILYLIGHGVEHAFVRALLPVSCHALIGVIMGFYLGKARFSADKARVKWLTLSLVVPSLLHGSYDFILTALSNWIYYMLPFMVFLWWFGLRKAKKARSVNMMQV
ncbi:intramembrane metalloprotease PrsW [Bacillus subtilis]|jgi:RsiW-degrading membrane proteinase PrsW (M82 family)|uniref:Protease PrsW n=4 Tax=Bacilli TaxID=91061 RepID=PRSW_BACSU|nr:MULTISPECIES: glutamic-type intramembrane protease PrsW [Bacillales]NP_390175.1 protease required for RsiW anti-sigma(W) degradation [Bacillus subtilis subsp. subtilis str. 168]P50738.1 RecName: Full=Protease PrsW; AltName: Full=Protease responsible for activating sigma-W; AltName: Full=Site-1 protease PrsW; Short=S1P protease PrsW [Bacillus subtilis subsp. subtilis str. 168]AOL30056.1 protease [Alkalicoccobacillus gibsonii]AXC53373.1 protease PrsW [Bacillus spizizenii]MDP4102312.1 glutamic